MRRVGIDPVLQTEQLQQANAFMSQSAIAMARQHVEGLFELQKKGWTTQINLGPLLPLTPDFHSVEIEWDERTYNKQGILQRGERWKAIVNLAVYNLDELKDARTMRNPLWVFVTDYSWMVTGPLPPEGAIR
jgi:type IV secretory pathway TrbF-like protein